MFAMIAQDMMMIADKFEKDIDEVHKLFYQLSCNREKLIKYLQGQEKAPVLWTELEDLALKDKEGKMYGHVLSMKGEKEVEERIRFLGICWLIS